MIEGAREEDGGSIKRVCVSVGEMREDFREEGGGQDKYRNTVGTAATSQKPARLLPY